MAQYYQAIEKESEGGDEEAKQSPNYDGKIKRACARGGRCPPSDCLHIVFAARKRPCAQVARGAVGAVLQLSH